MNSMRYYLASASPRRSEILGKLGIVFEVRVSGADESVDITSPKEVVETLSGIKASSVMRQIISEGEVSADTGLCVIGADTVVALDGIILGKPKDEDDAKHMLRTLSGRSHEVYTGVTIQVLRPGADQTESITFSERTEVCFAEMSEAEIDAYVGSGDPMDKAGAYGLQSGAGVYITGINGDFYNVVGLPLASLYSHMKEAGLTDV